VSRLLFAAARGARIQWQDSPGRWWDTIDYDLGAFTEGRYRIHPDDVHMQYGPISTALRWEAEHFRDKHYLMQQYTSAAIVANAIGSDWDMPMADKDVVMYLLILAEALADEGL